MHVAVPALKDHPVFSTLRAQPRAPVLLVVLDGVGLGCGDGYDAVAQARMPRLRALLADQRRSCTLRAHGTAVGLPSDDDMGNSEVGHNALGCGRIVQQGAGLVDDALRKGTLVTSAGYRDLQAAWRAGGTLHVIGLMSDGGVHSRLNQIVQIVEAAARDGARRVRIHALLDGRDVPDHSAQQYLQTIEELLARLRVAGVDGRIASGGGRMLVTMDRYESDWSIVQRGWRAHVHGDAQRFNSALQALQTLRAQQPGISDQLLPPFVIEDAGVAVGTINDGDAVLFANFRGDRALQISRAFEDAAFAEFDRGVVPKVSYAGLMQYDGDLFIPRRYLVAPPVIERTSGAYFAATMLRTFACSETQKFGHVTYFWNGNRSDKFDDALETYVEVPSYLPPFEERPQMRAAEIADTVSQALRSRQYDVLRANLANGDMVGHTGNLAATIAACEAADVALGTMLDAAEAVGAIAVVTADHGNADEMALRDKQGAPQRDNNGNVAARTAHTLAPVPFAITGSALPAQLVVRAPPDAGLANVAATVMNLLGYEAPADYCASLVQLAR